MCSSPIASLDNCALHGGQDKLFPLQGNRVSNFSLPPDNVLILPPPLRHLATLDVTHQSALSLVSNPHLRSTPFSTEHTSTFRPSKASLPPLLLSLFHFSQAPPFCSPLSVRGKVATFFSRCETAQLASTCRRRLCKP